VCPEGFVRGSGEHCIPGLGDDLWNVSDCILTLFKYQMIDSKYVQIFN
jgi:hypothetical protein